MKYKFKKSARSSLVWCYEFLAKYFAPHFEAKSKPPWPSMNALESWRPTLYLPISSACCTQILPHIFSFFTLFLDFYVCRQMFPQMLLFSHFFYIFLCLQADVPSNEIPPHRSRPQGELKHRLWHLLTPSSRPSSYLQDMFLTPFLLLFLLFLFTGQVHSPTWHRCLWRLSLQVPQQVINSHQQGVPEKSW